MHVLKKTIFFFFFYIYLKWILYLIKMYYSKRIFCVIFEVLQQIFLRKKYIVLELELNKSLPQMHHCKQQKIYFTNSMNRIKFRNIGEIFLTEHNGKLRKIIHLGKHFKKCIRGIQLVLYLFFLL